MGSKDVPRSGWPLECREWGRREDIGGFEWATVPNLVREGKEWEWGAPFLSLKKNFFLMCTILKVFLEFVTILFLFYLFIWCKACEILAPTLGIEPTPPASEVLTTSLPGKYPRSSNAVSWVWGTPRSPAWRPCMPPQSLASFSVYEWWVIIDNGYWCLLCARCGSKYFMCDN